MRASNVSAPTRSAFITRLPVPFIVAPVSLLPAVFLHRDGLARDHRLVDRAAPFDDGPVDRDLFAGPHAQQVARLDVRNRNVDLMAVSNRARRFRRHAQQRANGRAGPASCAELENLTEQHQHRHDDSRFEIRLDDAVRAKAFRKEAAARACRPR